MKRALIALLLITTAPAIAQPTPIARLEPSIVCRGERDYGLMQQRLRKAAKLGCRQVNFVFTVNCAIDENDQVIQFGLQQYEDGGQRGRRRSLLQPMDDELLDRMTQYYKEGISQALSLKMRVAILCHLDVATRPYAWRNYFRFDPTAKYEGYRYQDVLIEPLIEAIGELVPADVPVDLSIAGEMGQSVFAHADGYEQILTRIRTALPEHELRVGVSFNFNNVSGFRDPQTAHPFTAQQSQRVQQFLEACDFVGFSNYHALRVPPTPQDFRDSIQAFAADLRKHGVQLPAGARIHLSEIGLGGYGPDNQFTTDPEVAAKSPYNGPGRGRKDPWQDAGMRAFRVAYHRALLQFLADPQTPWPVDVAFLWTDNAWDPQGIADARYADDEIIRLIQRHNDLAPAIN